MMFPKGRIPGNVTREARLERIVHAIDGDVVDRMPGAIRNVRHLAGLCGPLQYQTAVFPAVRKWCVPNNGWRESPIK